jgi:hypothetical protein
MGAVLTVAAAGWAVELPGERFGGPLQQQAKGEWPVERPTAEVTFSTPRRFVVITEMSSRTKRVYEEGDALYDPLESSRAVRIQRIGQKRLKLQESLTRRVTWVTVGDVVPGFTDRQFAGTVLLKGLDFQYRGMGGPLDPEPRLVGIRADRATLEVDVPIPRQGAALTSLPEPGASATTSQDLTLSRGLDATLLGGVRVAEKSPHAYEVSAADLRAALDHGGQVLAEAWPTIRPLVSLGEGVSLKVQSPVAEGVLGPRGFRVTSPNLAARAGIQVGDTILAVNGQGVNTFLDLYRLYQIVRRDPQLSLIEVSLERQGSPVTKTYRIR